MSTPRVRFKKEVDRYFGELPGGMFEEVSCPICKTRDQSLLMFKKKTMRLMHCICGMVYNGRQPRQEALDRFYQKSKAMSTWASLKESTKEKARQEEKYSWAIDQIERLEPKAILDIGCGNGHFLRLVKDRVPGIRAVGIDQNESAVNLAKDKPGLEVDCANLYTYQTTIKYDFITLWGVLEHAKDPGSVLWKVKGWLSRGGKIIVCVPNHGSMAFQALRRSCYSYCPQHLWYFSLSTLDNLFSSVGLMMRDHTTIEPEILPILRHAIGFSPYRKNADTHVLSHYNKKYPAKLSKEIISNNSGYKLIAIAEPEKCTMQ